jgi:integrase
LANRLHGRAGITGSTPHEALTGVRARITHAIGPIGQRLGLKGGLHAFRHGNATAQDRLHTPMKVRQEQLGHAESVTTMGYTHLVSEDNRKLVEQLDDVFCRAEAEGILCASPIKKPLRWDRKSFEFNDLFGCGAGI